MGLKADYHKAFSDLCYMIKSDQNGIESDCSPHWRRQKVMIKSDQNGIESRVILRKLQKVNMDKIRPKWD